MALAPGTAIGPYEVRALIGKGGMGEVYRAYDARLARDVALKILPQAFSENDDRIRRFEQEARAAAALSHPNIISVYDVGHDGGTWYVVSELLAGQTLRERLGMGAVPIRHALEYSIQIAAGLAAAHERGIVHRDLKPENLFITSDEHVKILDFGVAKLTDAEPRAVTVTETAPGVVLGTVGYMSPEQVGGAAVDHRSDIFSFGAVLYEMVTGRRAFAKATRTQTMTAILEEDPTETTTLSSPLARKVMGLVRRCLDKSPQRRFQSAADLALVLTNELIEFGSLRAPATPWPTRRVLTTAAVALAFLATGVGIGWQSFRSRSEGSADRVAFTITLPPGAQLLGGHPAAISPDGKHIVYTVTSGDGRSQLFSKWIDRPTAVPLAGGENGFAPFFSPDGRSIAFFADGQLKRLPATGGVATIICPAPDPRRGVWTLDDRIVFAPEFSGGLFTVSASGGTPEALTTVNADQGEFSHRFPTVLPDNRGVLFTVMGPGGPRDLHISGLLFGSKAHQRIQVDAQYALYAGTGHLVYVSPNGETFGAPFDPQQLRITGAAVPLPERPAAGGSSGLVPLTISQAGTLVMTPFEPPLRSLVVVKRDGSSQALRLQQQAYRQPRVSPNGRRVAVVIHDGPFDRDIWHYDVAQETPSRLTFNRYSDFPAWKRDNATVAFSALEDRGFKLQTLNLDGSSTPQSILADLPTTPYPSGWLADDRSVLYTLDGQPAPLIVAPGERPRALTLPAPQGFSRFFQGVSPDGRWLAYVSNQTRQSEIYVTSFPDGEITRQVSRQGGESAVWAKTGSDLFYRSPYPKRPGEIMRVTIDADGSASTPTVVLRGDYFHFGPGSSGWRDYDVFPDGSFLMLKGEGPPLAPRIEVVVNWASQLVPQARR